MIRLRDRVQIGNGTPGVPDSHGNIPVVIDWETAPVEPAEVKPLTTTELTSSQDTVISRWRLTLCPVTQATSASLIRWQGIDYKVDGEVQAVPDDRSRTHHHTAVLQVVSG